MAKIYLDTSAINQLCYDPAVRAVIAGITRAKHEVHTSCLTILELCATRNDTTRASLLEIARHATQNFYPLDLPGPVLKASLMAYLGGKSEVEVSIVPGQNGTWAALCDPALINEPIREKVLNEKKRQDEWLAAQHIRAREGMSQMPRPMHYKPGSFFRSTATDDVYLESFFGDILVAAGDSNHNAAARKVLDEVGPWRGFFSALALEHYNRCVRSHRYGRQFNPGGIDVLQAVYLSGHDLFVSQDALQRRFMRNVCRIAGIKTVVTDYSIVTRLMVL